MKKIDLNKYIEDIIYNKEVLIQMGETAKKVAPKDVLEVIYKEIKQILQKCE